MQRDEVRCFSLLIDNDLNVFKTDCPLVRLEKTLEEVDTVFNTYVNELPDDYDDDLKKDYYDFLFNQFDAEGYYLDFVPISLEVVHVFNHGEDAE